REHRVFLEILKFGGSDVAVENGRVLGAGCSYRRRRIEGPACIQSSRSGGWPSDLIVLYVSHRTTDERIVTAHLTNLGIFDAVELLLGKRLNAEKTASLAVLVPSHKTAPVGSVITVRRFST